MVGRVRSGGFEPADLLMATLPSFRTSLNTESLLDGGSQTDGEQERAPDRPVGRRAICPVRAARLRRPAAADLSVAVRIGTGSRLQPPRPPRPGLVCSANRLLQGQACLL